MANRIQIRHGSTQPTTSNLLPYELGWDGTSLYINNNGTIVNVAASAVSGYLPLTGGTLTGALTAQSASGAAISSKNTTTSAEIQLTTNSNSNYQGLYSCGYYNGSSYVSTGKWIVYRDNSGNVVLGGNADTATKLATARTISLTGSVTGSGTFDGSGDLSIATTTNHNHDSSYVSKSGDTMSGNLIISSANGGSFACQNTTNSIVVSLDNGSSAGYHGVYSSGYYDGSAYTTDGKWIIYRSTDGEAHSRMKIYGAVWNDYAEYRKTKEDMEPGRCIIETGNDDLILSTSRMQPGAEIVSDTFGFAIGQTKEALTPVATSGRVLVYIYEGRDAAREAIGRPVCSGPNGTVSIMTDEEYKEKAYCTIGTISAVPDYEEWGENKIKVNGRIWIRVK